MKLTATSLLLCCGISAMAYLFWTKPRIHSSRKPPIISSNKDTKSDNETLTRLYQKSTAAKHFSKAYGYSTSYCFLLDMRINSGKKRFFIYNMDKDSVEHAGLVTHGGGSDNGTDELTFSNTPNSYCTSLGKYKVGVSYNGRFGLAYKLHGLDKTNSKAFERFVVLHGYNCVPDAEVAPGEICFSQGCPTVSPVFLRKLKTYIDTSPEPILLWIYY